MFADCLAVFPPRSDYDKNMFVTTGDIFAYLNDWFASCIGPVTACNNRSADFNCDGLLTPQDLFDFLNAWFLRI